MTQWDIEQMMNEYKYILNNTNFSYNDMSYQCLNDCVSILTLLDQINPVLGKNAELLLCEKINNSNISYDDYFSEMIERMIKLKTRIMNHIKLYREPIYQIIRFDKKIINLRIPIVRYANIKQIDEREYLKVSQTITNILPELKEVFEETLQGRLFIDYQYTNEGNVGENSSISYLNKSYILLNGINHDYFACLPHELTHAYDSKLVHTLKGKIAYSNSLISESNPLFTELVFLDNLDNERYFYHILFSYYQILNSFQQLAYNLQKEDILDPNGYEYLKLYVSKIFAFYMFYLYKNNINKYQEVKSIYNKNLMSINQNATNNIFLEYCANINNQELVKRPFEFALHTYAEHIARSK